MEAIIAFVSSYFSYWPLVCFLALILAGFNLPISEDVLIVMSALIAYEDRSFLVINYVALYFGIFLSDIICYWLGRLIGAGLLKVKFFTKALTPEKMDFFVKRLQRHGLLTFVVVRFIPFGMRNALFLTSGLIKLPFVKFAFFDSIAVLASSLTLYSIVLLLGKAGKEIFTKVGIALFVLIWGGILIFAIRKFIKSKKNKALKTTESLDEEN